MTLPNIITMARISLIPVFVIFLLCPWEYGEWAALVVFAIASMTDGIDGHIARKYNLVSDFGKFMDPTADKLLVSTAMVLLVEKGWLSGVMVCIILAREFMVTSLRQVAVAKGRVLAAAWSGKVKTTVQILGVLILLSPLRDMGGESITVGLIAGWVMTLVTIYSGYDYLKSNWDIIKQGTK